MTLISAGLRVWPSTRPHNCPGTEQRTRRVGPSRTFAQGPAPHNQGPWLLALPAGRLCIPTPEIRYAEMPVSGQNEDMDLDSGGVMSRSEFEDVLSRVVAGQLFTDAGAVPSLSRSET